MEGAIYLLCAATALACSLLLLRGFFRNRTRLLLWSGLFFLSMTLENVILFIDVVVVPDQNLLVFRRSVALAGTVLLLYGLIWDTK